MSLRKLTISPLFDETQNFRKIKKYELTIIKFAYHNLSPPFCIYQKGRTKDERKKNSKAMAPP